MKNILIFQTDQQRWDVSEPGHPCRTPHLQRMAEEGVRFSQVMPPMAHCCPSRASLMTGLYPSQHGVWNNVQGQAAHSRGLNRGVECWSERFRDAGYRMLFDGKWHVSATESPGDRGWDAGYVISDKATGDLRTLGKTMGFWRNQEIQDTPLRDRQPGQIVRPGWGDLWLYGTREARYEGYQSNEETPWDDGSNDAPILHSALGRLQDAIAGDEPWVSYIGLTGPHDPFIIPRHYAELYDPETITLPASWNDSLADRPAYYRRQKQRFDQLTEREKRQCIAHYWGYCTMIDDMFGRVLGLLEESGVLEDTVVIFCSDHGEFLGNHGLYLKGIAPYESGYRVPLLVCAPGHVAEPGRSCEGLVSLMDLGPTLCDLAGLDPVNGDRLSGRSLVPWLESTEPPADWRDALYLQCNGTEVYFSSRTVRTDTWKFVHNAMDFDELYNLRLDPDERFNVAQDPDNQGVLQELYGRMWQLAEAAEDHWLGSEYGSVSLAAYGPKSGLGG